MNEKAVQITACLASGAYLECALFFGKRIYPMRRPRGSKTKKSVAKRFKITGTGKVMCSHSGKRHLLAGKNAKRRRRLGADLMVSETDVYRIKQNLPFSH
jgi:large subunit ribosomal protein L35